jgi:cation diffusion facilitator CzcD-associated flavoprotein CzcO
MSGLATARACLEAGLRPRVFEQKLTVGGLWSPESPLCRQTMRTNISRHTVVFSRLLWASKKTFPTADEVWRYLSIYTQTFLDPDTVSFGHRVVRVSRREEGWNVAWEAQGANGDHTFDYLVVASGYFSKPYTPNIPGLQNFPGTVLHSSEYRGPEQVQDKCVAVVGDSLSAVEISGEIAPHVSNLIHIHPRPFWIFPRYLPLRTSDPQTPFAPLDLASFTRSSRKQPGEILLPSEEDILQKNRFIKSLCGDQSLLSPTLRIPENRAAFTAISEHYANAVRAGVISLHARRLESVQGQHLVLDDGTQLEEPVDVIITATGFRTSIPFFDDDILATLSYAPSDPTTPFLLYRNTLHPSLPTAAFVGMYRGPYQGVIELQARWAAKVLSGQLPIPSEQTQRDGIALERRIRERVPRLQFPHSDYVGMMADLAEELGIDPVAAWPGRNTNTVTPAQFGSGEAASQLLAEVEEDLAAAERGKWVAAAVYSALQGPWKIERRLESAMSSLPSGTFRGRASFIRRVTQASMPSSPEYEYGYLETGQLTADTGLQLDAQRRYRYVYDEDDDRIDAYFDDASDRGFFHSLRFLAPGEESHEGGDWAPWVREARKGWCAIGNHLCQPDTYDAAYWFAFTGVHLEEFRISYRVKGPNKDYVASAIFTR